MTATTKKSPPLVYLNIRLEKTVADRLRKLAEADRRSISTYAGILIERQLKETK